MRMRQSFFFAVVLGGLCFSSVAYAYLDNSAFITTGQVSSGARNASTDSAEIIYSNPAGAVFLKERFSVNLSGPVQLQERKFKVKGDSGQNNYRQEDTLNHFPNISSVLQLGNWTVFAGQDIPNGETVVNYPDGSPTTHLAGETILASPLHQSGYKILTNALTGALTAAPYNFVRVGDNGSGDKHIYSGIGDSYYEEKGQGHLTTLGIGYRFSKMLSVAVGVRHMNEDRITKAGVTIEGLSDDAAAMNSYSPGFFPESISFSSKQTMNAWGTGGFAGGHLRVGDRTDLAFQLQSPIKLTERRIVYYDDLNLFPEGEDEQRNDIPGMIGLGIGYRPSEKFRYAFDLNYWFRQFADMERYAGYNRGELAGDIWRVGASVSYSPVKRLQLSAGAACTVNNWKDLSLYASSGPGVTESLTTDNLALTTGVSFRLNKTIRLNGGISQQFFQTEDFSMESQNSKIDVSAENSVTMIALSLDIAVW